MPPRQQRAANTATSVGNAHGLLGKGIGEGDRPTGLRGRFWSSQRKQLTPSQRRPGGEVLLRFVTWESSMGALGAPKPPLQANCNNEVEIISADCAAMPTARFRDSEVIPP